MRAIITGASGFVGTQLVPLLQDRNIDLLLVGRDLGLLIELYPQNRCARYADLEYHARGYDTIVNLAVLNNDSHGELERYRRVNVDFLIELHDLARRCGIARFVDISSIRALDLDDDTAYAVSKREGTAALSVTPGPDVTTFYLPALYHRSWAGKMAFLNNLTPPLARAIFSVLAALKPTLDIAVLADVLAKPDWPRAQILTADQQRNIVFRFSKRTLDVGVALGLVVATFWIAIPIWIAIRLTSRGPGIFSQTRVGRNGRLFTCYKFRTMKIGTDQVATHQVTTAAVTGIGAFLRRTKLDELPQIWNVLRNDMSLVGPRPCLPNQVELIEARAHKGVLTIPPGITGLAQINDIDMSDPERLAGWDERYLKLRSLALDIRIILATIFGKGRGDRVSKGNKSTA